MDIKSITNLIQKSKDKKDNTSFWGFISTYWKTIKKWFIIIFISICIIKPSIPVSVIGNTVKAFVTEYVKIKQYYDDISIKEN